MNKTKTLKLNEKFQSQRNISVAKILLLKITKKKWKQQRVEELRIYYNEKLENTL